MKTEWVFIEIFAVFVENFAVIYFLNSRLSSRYKSSLPQLMTWFILVLWGLFATFNNSSVFLYDGVSYAIILIYLIIAKNTSIWLKLFNTILTYALFFGSSLVGASLASYLTNVNIQHTLIYQESSRLLAIIFIKMLQIVLFFVLAKKHTSTHLRKKKTALILSCAVIITLSCIILLFNNIPEFDTNMVNMMIWLAVGFIVILIIIFLLYEMFVREESQNLDLSTRLQRLELESHHFKEIDAMHTDIRKWKHEYKNNLIALRALMEHDENTKAIEYIDKMSEDHEMDDDILQTGNVVLDAVVSAKLSLARSRGIIVDIQAVYPGNDLIDDNDLCAITGNLLDNAIEACLRIDSSDENRKKFITFELLAKGKNLVLSITNSFNGQLKKEGGVYLTLKNQSFHGIGIRYVDSLVEKYRGHVLREHTGDIFKTHIVLPLVSALSEEER